MTRDATKDLHAPTITRHRCPTCGEADKIVKVAMPGVGQTAQVPLCDCYGAELKIDGKETRRRPARELVETVRSHMRAAPTAMASLETRLALWWDLLRPEPVPESERTIHRAALEYLDHGYAIVPLHGVGAGACTCRKGAACKSKGKHPIRTDWTNRAIRSSIELAAFFRSRGGRPTNIGILLDPDQGLILIDIDAKPGRDGRKTVAAHAYELGWDFHEYGFQDTPSGGWHSLFRLPEGFDGPLPNHADVVRGMDVFHRDHQFVVCPSKTEKGHYLGRDGRTVALPPIDELPEIPKHVLDFICSRGRGGRGLLGRSREGTLGSSDGPIQGPSVEAVRHVVAKTPNPADASYDAYIAMAHYIKGACGPDHESEAREIFHDWADRWEGGSNDLDTNDEKFDSVHWGALRSGWRQLLQAAAAFGAELSVIAEAKAAEAQEVFDVDEDAEDPAEGDPMGDWERPIPIVSDESIQPFPLGAVPPAFRRYVESVAETLEVPADVPAINLLGAVAGAAQSSLEGIRVHEDYLEPIGLFLACQLHSGEGRPPR